MEKWVKIQLKDFLSKKILWNAYAVAAIITQNAIIFWVIEMDYLNLFLNILGVKAIWKKNKINKKKEIQTCMKILFNLVF